MLKDPDPQMASLATAEIASLRSTLQTLISTSFPGALVKSHSTSTSSSSSTFSAIIELKSGVGGDEASLFLGTVLRMYTRLASTNGFKPSIVSSTALEGSGGGYKEALLEVEGEGSYDLFRWETGVHRVQRVPATETSGRTHTSTITVLVGWNFISASVNCWSKHSFPCLKVLPSQNSSNLSEEADVLNEKDVRIDVMRSRGAGGQVRHCSRKRIRFSDYDFLQARQPNRISCSTNARTHRNHSVNARFAVATPSLFPFSFFSYSPAY
jgi:peptide chain release factor 1